MSIDPALLAALQARGIDPAAVLQAAAALPPHILAGLVSAAAAPPPAAPPPAINADFYDVDAALTEEERALRDRVRAFLEAEVRPHADAWWERAAFPMDLIPAFGRLARETLTADPLQWPAASPLALGMISLELGRIDPSVCSFFSVHWGLATGTIALFGSAAQRAHWLPRLADMSAIGSWALTEPDVGSAAAKGLGTTARRDGDRWVLNGAKKWSGNAPFADVNVIWAVDKADGEVKGFLVERDTPGYHVAPLAGKIAKRAVQNAVITLTDCVVPDSARLPGARSFRDVGRLLASARALVAWEACGIAIGAYEAALAYSLRREQFDRPIAGFQLMQDKLVRMLADITAMKCMLLQLARLEARDGHISHPRASLAKVFCTERMRAVVALARDALGGNGILLEHGVARLFADAEAVYSYEGTREMNTLIVGRAITGISAFT